MTKYSKRHPQTSEKVQEDALKIAKATQKPGQTKEQTKLITQGIQKGIEQYKKQQKSKVRDLDKKLKSVSKSQVQQAEAETVEVLRIKQHWLPWVLLAVSWLGFAAYFMLVK